MKLNLHRWWFPAALMLSVFSSPAVADLHYPAVSSSVNPLATLIVSAKLIHQRTPSCAIHFTIENTGRRDVMVIEDDLPWLAAPSLILAIVPTRKTSSKINQLGPLSEARLATAQIVPGKPVEGNLFLSKHFQHIENSLFGHGYLLVWSFEVGDLQSKSAKRFSGVLEMDNP